MTTHKAVINPEVSFAQSRGTRFVLALQCVFIGTVLAGVVLALAGVENNIDLIKTASGAAALALAYTFRLI